MPVAVVPGSQRAADADGGFIAAHDGIEQGVGIGTFGLRGGQRHRNDHRPRMQDRATVHVVHFQHVAQRAIEQQRIGHATTPRPQRNRAAGRLLLHQPVQLLRDGIAQRRQRTAQPVHQQQRGTLPGHGIHRLLQALGKLFGQAGGRCGHGVTGSGTGGFWAGQGRAAMKTA